MIGQNHGIQFITKLHFTINHKLSFIKKKVKGRSKIKLSIKRGEVQMMSSMALENNLFRQNDKRNETKEIYFKVIQGKF